ncbi:hypothetical protein BGW36DRAFT_372558 [Talaromyces proteolyticus]|uniref:Uncharacterized protein n=1 Tax=Talaromyces proteolyticus TaxID=1131652 RepID=A0AAD4PZ69_9EURO|nr:uncharacterized protein BGW36DRAFT_372558 [Talaromyces proteolyticus]KAH8702305.1 hypothetical protein BGW36DRAFT_372558 [Talaromyces proteolyticus]
MPFQLSQEQIDSYHKEGFLILRAHEHQLLENPHDLQVWSEEVKAWPREPGKWMPYDEKSSTGERILMRTENFVDWHPQLQGLICGKALGDILGTLAGDEVLLFKDKINYKQAKSNGFRAHLDARAYAHLGDMEHITANFAVDPATPENGCLEIVPGSHKMEVDCTKGFISLEWQNSHEWIKVPLDTGDILIFGSHLAHRSAPNNTDKARASVYATFHNKSEGTDLRKQYYDHRRIHFPPDHERVPDKDYSAGYFRYSLAAPFYGSWADNPTSEARPVAVGGGHD